MLKVGARQGRRLTERSLQLLEKYPLFFEPGPDLVDGLLGEEPKFQQSLLVFPLADAYEDGGEKREEQKNRKCYRTNATAPQRARLSGENEHQWQNQQHAERVPDPPGNPTRRQIGQVHDTECRQTGQREGGTGQAKERGEHQKK